MTGSLVVAGTPIGNSEDASARLKAALASASLIAAEDTRRLRRLAGELGITLTGDVVSFFEGNEANRTAALLQRMQDGAEVLLVSDAGMPTVSDPGHRLVAACADNNIPVSVLPGPSAPLAALAVAGLPTDRFAFEGFPPRRSGPRRRYLAALRDSPYTLIFFESPRRLADMLHDVATQMGSDRPVVVCRELTKTHEEIKRGSALELARWAEPGVLGEVVVLVGASQQPRKALPSEQWSGAVAELVSEGLSRRDAVDAVALDAGVSRREVFAQIQSESRSRSDSN
ncbi:MAG: 16S rRNA (cytidine(1402)-2'-O)-methyltransferase [Actinomycetia bacterium]|nr:16S rRNA (cytidine(1402)-2'-O)-methyltransferase [Actinomycetes bacterium]